MRWKKKKEGKSDGMREGKRSEEREKGYKGEKVQRKNKVQVERGKSCVQWTV